MRQPGTCPRCGAPLELRASGGDVLCARCLARSLDGVLVDDRDVVDAPPVLPRTFGAYELLEEIGRGGMGVVYRARQTALDRVVAVKLLLAGPYSSETILQRFRLEAAAAASLQHPHIVPIHDYGECDGQPFYAMDLIAGRNLAEICDGRPLPARRAAELGAVLARAVQHAHDAGIVHRDLKPSNVLIDADGQPHILDFGLAKRLDRTEGVTLSGQMVGSPSYAAPEQAAGHDGQVGVASDVYGLGALLYHLLTGRPPFNAATPTETLRLVLDTEPPPPRLLNPGLPRDLETIGLTCLAKEPARRYATAAALADDCERFLAQRPIRARPPGVAYRLGKLVRRHRFGCVAVAAVVGLAAAGLVVFVRAARSEAIAQQRRTQIEQIFARALHVADPGYSRGRQATLKDLLDDTASWVPEAFANDPRLEAGIHARIGETYCKLSLFESAVPHLESAWATRERMLSEEDSNYLTSLRDLAVVRLWQQRYAEAEAQLDRVLAIQTRTLGRDAQETLRTCDEITFGRALRLTLGMGFKNEEERAEYAKEQRRFARESYELANHRWGAEHPITLVQEQNLGVALMRGTSAEIDEGERVLAHNQQFSARVLGPEHPTTVSSMAERGWALVALKRNDEALALLEECVPLAERAVGTEHHVTAYAMQGLEHALREAGRPDEANALVPRYMAAWLRVYGPGNNFTRRFAAGRLHLLAANYGRPDEAARFAQEQLIEFRDRQRLGPDSPIVGTMLLVLADARLAQDRVAEAQELLHQATAILAKEEPTLPPLWLMHCRLGDYLRAKKDFAAAEAELRVAYEGICDRETWDASARRVRRWTVQALVHLCAESGRTEEATEWRQTLEALDRADGEKE